jgi:hypothetical protein
MAVIASVPKKQVWAQQDDDEQRAAAWERVGRLLIEEREGFRAYVARRIEWLGLSPEQQQQRVDAGRKPVTASQLRLLRQLNADADAATDSWQASKLISRLLRERDGRRGGDAA